jgi:hypothetical protein
LTLYLVFWAVFRIAVTVNALALKGYPVFWAMVGLDAGIGAATAFLVKFHIFIWRKGITTFTWIKFKTEAGHKE